MPAAQAPRPTIRDLNALDEDAFTALLGAIYERSPWVARRCWQQRPFASLDALQGALARVLDEASTREQMEVVCAHPQLSGKAAVRGELTADSRREQAGAGLDHCTPEELAQLDAGNRAYAARFGFPFIIAVKGLGRRDIIDALQRRGARSRDQEFAEALAQIHRIAALRLRDRISD
jgi:2-oxo-4-hydroxy-4-carboxy-5-ureidoimidazoline decarboxylase